MSKFKTAMGSITSVLALSLLLAAIFLATPSLALATVPYSGGSGTSGAPYQIADAADWTELTSTTADWNKYFILTADIDFAGASLTPVGNSSTYFTGVFDGNDHVLSHASIGSEYSSYMGVFGYIGSSGEVSDLGAEDIEINGEYKVGGLAGYNAGTITGCYATGAVSSTDSMGMEIGGLVGYNTGTITDSYAAGPVTLTGGMMESEEIGGLVGSTYGGTITGCYATGAVGCLAVW